MFRQFNPNFIIFKILQNSSPSDKQSTVPVTLLAAHVTNAVKAGLSELNMCHIHAF
jgi:hypothetical protein